MTLDAHVPNDVTATLNGKPVTIKPVTIRGVMRLAKLLDTVKTDLGMTYGDFSQMELNGAGLARLVSQVFEACVAAIDLDQPELTGTPLRVFTELAALFGVTVDDMLDADVNHLYGVVLAFWEVNGGGPLGAKIRATIASLMPMVETATEVMKLNFRKALITGPLAGGTAAGGTTESSSPSIADSAGTSNTSSTDSPPGASSESSQALDTYPDTSPPSPSGAAAAGETVDTPTISHPYV